MDGTRSETKYERLRKIGIGSYVSIAWPQRGRSNAAFKTKRSDPLTH